MAIHNKLPRKGYSWTENMRDDTFYIDGMSRKETMKELKEYADSHPEKWIYYHDCGYGPGYPVPTCKHVLEVRSFDKRPAVGMLFYSLYQEGCDGLEEIDDMSQEEVNELRMKQLRFFCELGHNLTNH